MMEPYQQRVVDEKIELDAKLGRLDDFLKSQGFAVLGHDEQSLLTAQSSAMKIYSIILGRRIKAFGEGSGT